MLYKLIFLSMLIVVPIIGTAQEDIYNHTEDESSLYASTKQVNQFIRRFNGEETLKGKRLYPKDKKYRNYKLRQKYFSNLFNNEDTKFTGIKDEFIGYVNSKTTPKYFDFYGGNWFAEVSAKFTYKGTAKDVLMFFKLEKQTGGFKWSFSGAYAGFMEEYFKTSTPTGVKFIHPMSHEIDFMSLRKVFKNSKQIDYYADKNYSPDYLTMFFYFVKKGDLVFNQVTGVKFHVFQLKNWYFEMQYYNRAGDNTGWLISNLVKVPDNQKKALMKLITK